MKKLPLLLVAAGLLLPVHAKLMADEDEKKSEYRFEFKVAKKRVSEDRKEKKAREQAPGGADTEMWLYKVQVENKSLSDVEGLEVQYTLYLSPLKSGGGPGGPPGGGGGRPGGAPQGEEPSVRTVTGEASLEEIERGDRATFETTASAVAKGGKQRGGPPGGGRGGPGGGGRGGPGGGGQGGQGGGPGGETGPEKLDGIKVELYLDGEKIDEHIYGSAAKRAAVAEEKSLRKAERDEREHREEDEN